MTLLALRKNEPAPDGFFDMERTPEDRRASFAARRAARVSRHSGDTILRADRELTSSTGAYALTMAEARDANAVLDMPEQPVYDWSDVAEDEDA